MALGLATGMGYLIFAALFVVIMGLMTVLLYSTHFGEAGHKEKLLKITIPENLDYSGIFDDVFEEYTTKYTLQKVRTTNMGSLFELQYTITLKEESAEKAFLDALRCRNGNLTIACGRVPTGKEELL